MDTRCALLLYGTKPQWASFAEMTKILLTLYLFLLLLT